MNDGVWKWIAAVLAAVLLAGAPGIIQATRAPTREEVELIRERQQIVLQRLAAIEQRLEEIDRRIESHDSEGLRE